MPNALYYLFKIGLIDMIPLQKIQSRFVPLPMENVDTDQIIPARFLKATTRDGFGKNLFRDWRYENNDDTRPKTDFCIEPIEVYR